MSQQKAGSSRGRTEEVNFQSLKLFITDSSQMELDLDTTVEKLYEETKVNILPLSIATKRETDVDHNYLIGCSWCPANLEINILLDPTYFCLVLVFDQRIMHV